MNQSDHEPHDEVGDDTEFKEKMGLNSKTGFTKQERGVMLRAITLMSQIAFTVIACVFIGVFLGRFLDGLLGTSPWLLIIFALLGTVSAFKAMIDIAKKF